MRRDATPLTITSYTTLVHPMPHFPVSERTRGRPHEKGGSLLTRCLGPCYMPALLPDHGSGGLHDARAHDTPGTLARSRSRALQRERAQHERSHGSRMTIAHDRAARRPRDRVLWKTRRRERLGPS